MPPRRTPPAPGGDAGHLPAPHLGNSFRRHDPTRAATGPTALPTVPPTPSARRSDRGDNAPPTTRPRHARTAPGSDRTGRPPTGPPTPPTCPSRRSRATPTRAPRGQLPDDAAKPRPRHTITPVTATPEAPRRPTSETSPTRITGRRLRPSTRATHRTRPHRPEPRHHPPHHDGRPHGDNTAAPARHIGHDPHANNLVSDTDPPPAARPEANRLAPLTNPYQQPGGTRPRRDRRFPGPKRGLVLYVLIRIARPRGQGSCQSGRPSDGFKGATVDPEGADLAGGGRALDAPPPPTISPDSRRPRTHLEPTSEPDCSPGFRHPPVPIASRSQRAALTPMATALPTRFSTTPHPIPEPTSDPAAHPKTRGGGSGVETPSASVTCGRFRRRSGHFRQATGRW